MMRRQSGICVPLFSLVSTESWGIGEFTDLAMFSKWAAEAGQSVVQILPINEMPPIERSPYSAMSAMALDPIYIALPQLVDFAGLGGELALNDAERATLRSLRHGPRINYAVVRQLTDRWLRRSFDRFLRLEDLPTDALAGVPADVTLVPEYADIGDQLERKIVGISLYESQISRLFGKPKEMADAVRAHARQVAGLGNVDGFAERYWASQRV